MKKCILLTLLFGAFTFSLSAQVSKDALPALVQVLGQTDDPQFQLDVLRGMSDGLKGRRNVNMPAGWETLASKLGKSSNLQIRELTRGLSLTFGSPSALAELRKVLLDPKESPASRQSALDSLLQARDPALAEALRKLLADPAMRSPALRGLAAYEDAKTPGAILSIYSGLTAPEKKDALNTLASRQTFARALLAAVAEMKVPAKELTADVVRQLRNFKLKEIDQQVEKLWGLARETEADKLKEIAKYKSLIKTKGFGDEKRGRFVFSRICQQCHTLFDAGGKVGPDITGSNRADLDYILQNVIDPNAVIPNDYRTSNLETKDERVITGIVTRQDASAVTIVIATETIIVARSDIKSLVQNEISMMPEGIIQSLTEAEVRDLLAYLKSPVQVAMPANASK